MTLLSSDETSRHFVYRLTSSILALTSVAIAATVGIGIISTLLFVSLILIFIQGGTKGLLEK